MKYKCPCCGYYTFEEEPNGNYEICPVCFWEDDPKQAKDEMLENGANPVSLNKARENFTLFGACSENVIKYVREPLEDEKIIHNENETSKETASLDKNEIIMETKRLILRRWKESDADDLYKYASNPDVGPIAGWPVHKSVEESLDVIKNVFNGKEAYAICLKSDGKAIGAIELKLNGHTDMTDKDDECELGYWIGKPFWGQGLVPEAAGEIIRHAFEDCEMSKIWCGYYDGNNKSKRVQEKCGFKYQWTTEDVDVPLMKEKRTGHVNLLTKEDWLNSH